MGSKKSADGIVGSLDRTEGQNMTKAEERLYVSEVKKKQKTKVEISGAHPKSSGRNPQEYGKGASNAMATRDNFPLEKTQMMEAVVEKGNMTLSDHMRLLEI